MITEGNWPAKIKSWELKDINGSLVLEVWFNVSGEDWSKAVRWSGWFLKKDGTRNEHTYKTIRIMGFAGDDISQLATEDDALDTTAELNVDVESDGEYWNVKWVNDGSVWKSGAVTDKAVLKGHDLTKLNSFLGPAKPKNMAPPAMDTDEDIDNFLDS